MSETIETLAREAATALEELEGALSDAANEVGSECYEARRSIADDRHAASVALLLLWAALPPESPEGVMAWHQERAVREGYAACSDWADGWRRYARTHEATDGDPEGAVARVESE